MSEYQYYEWQTSDRVLTPAEQAAVSQLSSHIDVTSTRAWVEYHWGDFKHDPKQVLARYFDAFLYYANWGGQRLAFCFPKGLLDADALQPYLWEYISELEPAGEHLIDRGRPLVAADRVKSLARAYQWLQQSRTPLSVRY